MFGPTSQSRMHERVAMERRRLDLLDPRNCCPTASSLSYYHTGLQCVVVSAITCKRWGCSWCRKVMTRRFMSQVCKAKPNRFVTLTVANKLWADPFSAWDFSRKRVSGLISFLRKRYGDIEYARVLESTDKGWPHYHLIVRSGYLPWKVIRDRWQKLTGAIIVDIRPIDDPSTAAKYVAKYVSKEKAVPWTNRRITFSRNFLVSYVKPKTSRNLVTDVRRHHVHPGDMLEEHFANAWFEELSPCRWAVRRSGLLTRSLTDEELRDHPYYGLT